jgi:exodeoxyribonuclease III
VLVVTYNVNSLLTRLPRLTSLLELHRPDVALVQETKSTPEGFPHLPLQAAGYVAADHSAGRWAGVAILARSELGIGGVTTGLPGEPEPAQARWMEATVGDVRFASVYVPNGRMVGSDEFAAKLRFLDAMADRAAALASTPSIVAGDFNVCPTDLDVWDTTQVHGATHITPEERSRWSAVRDTGYTDAFRHLNPDDPGFTWWDYRAGHFPKGYGLRIDHALVSMHLADRLEAATVERAYRKVSTVPGTKPSDHAPLLVRLGAG